MGWNGREGKEGQTTLKSNISILSNSKKNNQNVKEKQSHNVKKSCSNNINNSARDGPIELERRQFQLRAVNKFLLSSYQV